MRFIVALILMTRAVWADGEPAGKFDYYVLSLSWSPTWCALEGDARNSEQCEPSRKLGWVMHGLWPQNETGWPSYCRTSQRDPSKSQTSAMSDIMGTSGAAWYQWKKHGRCSGLSAPVYFETARTAYRQVVRPSVFRKLDTPVKLPASVVEDAFLKENPSLTAEMLTVTCKSSRIQEVRICLTKDLQPRNCGNDVARDCQMTDALFAPLK
ncbi:MAG: ribonuclease T2 family protein [Marinosulfonomonas sp.]